MGRGIWQSPASRREVKHLDVDQFIKELAEGKDKVKVRTVKVLWV